jgi:hypothetical protein
MRELARIPCSEVGDAGWGTIKAAIVGFGLLLLAVAPARAQNANTVSAINQLAGTASMLTGQVSSLEAQHQALARCNRYRYGCPRSRAALIFRG